MTQIIDTMVHELTLLTWFGTNMSPIDLDECSSSPCGVGSDCKNLPGSYSCECKPGYTGEPKERCTDINECAQPNACGINAKCANTDGSFSCSCPSGFGGDPKVFCQNINECEQNPCGENANCKDTEGAFVCMCKEDFTGDPIKGCIDLNECEALEKPCGTNAICENTQPGYNCLCPQGFEPRPNSTVACEQVDVTVLCKSKFDCVNNAECIEGQCFCQDGFKASGSVCNDIDECLNDPCGINSVCSNTPGGFHCECLSGFVGSPPNIQCKAPCEDVKCGEHAFCKPEGRDAYCMCEDGWNYNPKDISAGCVDIDECDKSNGPYGRCGENAMCENSPGSFSCKCSEGFSGNPFHQCLDIDECMEGKCGLGAICENTPGSFKCSCPPDTIPDPDPFTRCVSIVTCVKDIDCPGNAICDKERHCFCPEPNIGNDCRHPCEGISCGPNSECMLIGGERHCLCKNGYTGTPNGCVDIDECQNGVCAEGAVCHNEPGSYRCQCPGGSTGDPYRGGCSRPRTPDSCGPSKPCSASELCITDQVLGGSVCVCQQGYSRDQSGVCIDINECVESREKPPCGLNAVCKNLPGSYECQCPSGFSGNPYRLCEECTTLECKCRPPYKIVNGDCVLSECSKKQECPDGAECITIAGGVSYCACPKGMESSDDGSCKDVNECSIPGTCGYGAECVNLHGSYKCLCPDGYTGDPYRACAPNQVRCATDDDCSSNEKCIQPGNCICPPPYFTDVNDDNKCKSPCERFPCGLNAKCTPSDPPKCHCAAGYKGDPLLGCVDEDECTKNPCGLRAHCINEKGSYKCVCPFGTKGDPYRSGCTEATTRAECSKDEECAGQLACVHGSCVNPCNSLPCGRNAYCEPENHAAWCRCAVGFVESSSGDCVSPCLEFMCGKGAQCIVTSNGPTCKCSEGTRGNPFPGGECSQDVCSPSKPCDPPAVCISGRCREKCQDVVCGIGAKCDPVSGQCICNSLFIGNPDLICVPPVMIPKCLPVCGINAHCSYGINGNLCACNPGTTGNPYDECKKVATKCTEITCGKGATCIQDSNSVECLCPPGYRGNPYVECQDIDECVGNACGSNAVCINVPGSYDCRCKEGYIGNPFSNCMPLTLHGCQDPSTCSCSKNNPCPTGYTCKRGKCKNQCEGVKCGPRAACVSGKCVCPPGLSGNANDLKNGCQVQGQCANDFDCKNNEICFQQSKGIRQCLDACKKIQCGPNALCVSDKHKSSCICADGFSGIPSDLSIGCQSERTAIPREECQDNSDCSEGLICSINLDGIKSCIDPCKNIACGQNEECSIDKQSNPICKCLKNYIKNPISSSCEKPSLPDCKTDKDCKPKDRCAADALGILKCVDVCRGFTCPLNAICVASAHSGYCQCKTGFTGNPNDRNGCVLALRDTCNNDAQCMETEKCKKGRNKAMSCRPACDGVKCGPGAICVANNHVGQCQCPPGPYLGDPVTTGCKQVRCVYNTDCPDHQLCNRLSNKCYDVCDNYKCGDNSVCIGESHRAVCQCPPGFKANPLPEIECVRVNVCEENPCHPTAICEPAPSFGYRCKCPPNTVGDPISGGCRTEGYCPNGDSDCPPSTVCQNSRCLDPCEQACGANALCTVVNRKPVCSCPPKFQSTGSSPKSPCIRKILQCSSDSDCSGDICINNQCQVICRSSSDCYVGERCIQNKCQVPCVSHSQCLSSQACVSGVCTLGCRSNKDCPNNHACVNNKCQDPCKEERACGDNALCTVENHTTVCKCPEGFLGNPDPEQECIRLRSLCVQKTDCPANEICVNGECQFSCSGNHECAAGERCSEGMCVRICFAASNCPPGQLCIDSVCKTGCFSNSDCLHSQVCVNSKCECSSGYVFDGSNCKDIDECLQNPCHPTAKCTNNLGSFTCSCENGRVGNPFSEPGCMAPDQCQSHEDCDGALSCISGKCSNPCQSPETPCGPTAVCQVSKHILSCICPSGYLGDPYDLNLGCFKVECTTSQDCPKDKFCDIQSYKCMNPCDKTNCGHGSCFAENHKGICLCYDGYAMIDNKCVDEDECLSKPCHPTAVCKNTIGSYACLCENGLVEDPVHGGCRKPGDCFSNEDCPITAACIENTCRDPCLVSGTCGRKAICTTINHVPTCSCPARTTGDPKVKCTQMECSDHSDCRDSHACVLGHCINPCSLENVCGENTDCHAEHNAAVCSCKAGTTGDPHLGCVPLQYCSTDSQCQAGTSCHNGICLSICTSTRECITDQLCISNVCQPTCHSNSTCPDFQYCLNSICVRELRCERDGDCEDHQRCITNSVGQAVCDNVCDGNALCGRNAECTAKNHKPICSCKAGYHGNPQLGCQRIECQVNNDCSDDKICEDFMCKISCLVNNPCGHNALCSAESHKQVCYCQPGYTGDPYSDCTAVDYCLQNPCGPGATCANARGTHKCLCPLGTVGDPYKEGCTPPVECQSDEDCPIAAVCTISNGQPKCRDVCEDKACGINAECVAGKHEGICTCNTGYEGNPDDVNTGCRPKPIPCKSNSDCPHNTHCYGNLCRTSCRSHSECGLNEQCLLGHCGNPCIDSSTCGLNAQCQTVDHIKHCSCPPGFTGNELIECVRIPTPCNVKEDCIGNSSCRDNVCRHKCVSDNECALNEKCLKGDCILTCRVDNDCFLGHICLHNMCLVGCHSDDDCSASESCRDNKCMNPCLESTCGPNAICSVSNQRAVCSCGTGFVPNPSATVACVRAPAPPCRENRDCSTGTTCISGICRPVCATDSGCLSNEKCDLTTKVCQPLCRKDDDCRSGEVCQDFICAVGCRSDFSCSENKACVNSKCIDLCESPTACGTNAKCSMSNHQKVCKCPEDLTGDPHVSCKNPTLSCYGNGDCPPGTTCYGDVCLNTCKADVNCLSDERCLNGVCKTICNSDSKCSKGQICENRVCELGCRSDIVCPDNQACIDKQCRDPCEAATTCGSCAECAVVNHGVICSCPPSYFGHPLIGCTKPPIRCNETCPCDEATGHCQTLCHGTKECPCGSVCFEGVCAATCSTAKPCIPGQLCRDGICRGGCQKDTDCPNDRSCSGGLCRSPCDSGRNPCGIGAECRVSDHKAVCLCPAGTLGDPTRSCKPFSCTKDEDCEGGKSCGEDKVCRNPCLQGRPCGVNAQCKAADRRALCSCPPGFHGNPLTECKPGPSDTCSRNPCGPNTRCRDVSNGYECSCNPGCTGDPYKGCRCQETRIDHCAKAKCGMNASCRPSGSTYQCFCPPEFPLGDPKNRCIKRGDCRTEGCGVNAVCTEVELDKFECTCPPGTKGSPQVHCKPECESHEDCPAEKACINQECIEVCSLRESCGQNALCQPVEHHAKCVCPECHSGDPRVICTPDPKCQETTPIPPQIKCKTNSQCPSSLSCFRGDCRDPCLLSGPTCDPNKMCRVRDHRPQCVCKYGFSLSANGELRCAPEQAECREDADCPSNQACVLDRCQTPCIPGICPENKTCLVLDHRPVCVCTENCNPEVSICLKDAGCPPALSCRNYQCVNPCANMSCPQDAPCFVEDHKAVCRFCPQGYSADPKNGCIKVVGCLDDSDCAEHQACLDQSCQDPCLISNPCQGEEECHVHDHQPACVKVCQCQRDSDCHSNYICDGCHCVPPKRPEVVYGCEHCPPGIPCDPLTGACIKETTPEPGCSSDSECSSTEACINRKCVNPCSVSSPCGKNALCEVVNHKSSCNCPEGFEGNPLINCYRKSTFAGECSYDSDCASQLACINQKCQDPCIVGNPCGTSAECTTIQHRPSCACPQGWAGDPQSHCYKPECRVDSDCLYDKACISGNCLSPCREGSCGRGAECRAIAHTAQCVCPQGTQGNPHVSCVTVICQYNEDCADHEACDRLNRVCRPVCETETCGTGATCVARDHQPKCSCQPGFQGDPYTACTGVEAPECTQDADCPSKTGCINRKCQNPCSIPAVCALDQECRVQDTLPLRTVMCICPPDTIASADGHCRPIEQERAECRIDSECKDSERCVRGSCIEACRVDHCGLNALCSSTRHLAICSCPTGYVGNPHVECSPEQRRVPPSFLPVPECTHDDDCAGDKRCRNQLCINPCASDSPCAPGAFCHMQDHQPVCRCPAGFQGDPFNRCIPPTGATTGCASNSECTSRESCVNKLCVNPCNCGPNAECKVQNHYPICYCKPGYSGNPQIGCVKVGCETDSQCSDDQTCYNGECVNPCILGDPCGLSAVCHGLGHAAQCQCYPGYTGNPSIRCERIECNVDNDCPQDRTCLNHRCINPCTDIASPPCAPNAICYVRNHQAGCRCPEHMPLGDPLGYCQRTPPATVGSPECEKDTECPSKEACINNKCRNPCIELSPCTPTSMCSVFDTTPVRTMVCTCPEGWVPDNDGECKPVVVPTPPGCVSDNECSDNETCINRLCRNPCNCGPNAECFISSHRPVCSCKPGYDGNPNIGCRTVGCRADSECGSGKACINGNCINPCVIEDPCGSNAECYAVGTRAECRCLSGYRGNPYDQCLVVGCRSNADCPSDRACINAQCINPCTYEHPCAPRAECIVQNHLPLCKCPPEYEGNPYTSCRLKIQPECRSDGDCPSLLACFNQQCKNPCREVEPCQRPAQCEAVSTLPVRTMICECPPGYISSGSGTCKATPPVTQIGECTTDSDCPSDRACINAICKKPCNCGPNAECRIRDHKPVCSCLPGYEGNPELGCVKAGCRTDSDCSSHQACLNRDCVPACSPDGSSCGTGAICYGSHHTTVCECPPGFTGDPQIACVHVECESNSDCPSDKACINSHCTSPCAESNPCASPSECTVYNHVIDCTCPPGYIGDIRRGCVEVDKKCTSDSECPSQTACINGDCVNPCNATEPCGKNSICKVFDTLPVRTMICECITGYRGNAAVECVKVSDCPPDKGFVRDENGKCVCPPGTGLNSYDECERCPPEKGLKVDDRGRCICDLEKGLIIDERGNCVCPAEHGYRLDINGNCIPGVECKSDDECSDDQYCKSGACTNPCDDKQCGINALCNATNHAAVCICITGYNGDPEKSCQPPTNLRTDFPRPELAISCLSYGVQVEVHIEEKGFNGVLYVKGHSKDENCRRVVSLPNDSPSRTEIFKVTFGSCGLIHVNGQASFVLVIQKHPMLVTFKTQAYHIKCVYTTGEQNVTLGFNVSMLTTAGTIANTGPPPTCYMRIVTHTGQEINSAEIGDNLMLQVDVQPSSIYGGFARSCVAKTMENTVENEYIVTDENGCATDPTIFGEWDYNAETHSLIANFNAFKFPSSDNIRFQCNIRVCFGKCQPVNCRGYNAFGRRRREIDDRNRTGAEIAESLPEGQLREEITIQSNAILTFERREERFVDPREGRLTPEVQQIDDICVSMIGFIIALVITALLALVAVAVAVSCWLVAYRRRPKTEGPLPHPPDFPNPLFTTPDPLAEPSPDYLS